MSRIEQLLVQVRKSVEGPQQQGAAFVELGQQLALLSRLLGEQDCTVATQVPLRVTTGLNEQLADAQQQDLAELSTAQQEFAALQQQLETAQANAAKTAKDLTAARQHEAQLQEQVMSHEQRVSQLEGGLSTAQQDAAAVAQHETACLQHQLQTGQQEVTGLRQQLTASQQQVADLQQQLSTEHSRVAALEQDLTELRTTLKDRSTALESAQQHVEQLKEAQKQQGAACAAAAAAYKQLSTDLSNLQESSRLQLQELQQHVTEVHTQLSASQQEQQLLQGQLARLGDDNTSLQTELAGTQNKATNLMVGAEIHA
jgi:DNA repair exonuclease SbcCD ATPase subunit